MGKIIREFQGKIIRKSTTPVNSLLILPKNYLKMANYFTQMIY